MALWLQILRLEILRVARGWRWRGVLLAAALGAFWWRREGFDPGNPIFFPLGNAGILGFTALWVGAAALLGTDALGQIRRSKAGRLFDTRPAPGISLAASRWAAAALLLSLGAAGFLIEIIVLRKMMQEPCSWPPLAALWLFWWIPMISLGVSLGLGARSWIRNDAAALSAALILALALGWVFWRLLMPIEFFQSYASHLGVLLPLRFWALDLPRILLLAWAIVVVGAVGQRVWMPKRSVQIHPPYKPKAFSTFRRLLYPVWQVRYADNPTRAAAFAGLIFAGAIGWHYRTEWIFRTDSPAFGASWRQDAAPLPPELAQRKMPAWRVKDLLAELDDRGAKPVMRFTLQAANPTTATLSRGAFALTPALIIEPGGGAPAGLENGPVHNTYLFNWAPPFDPGTTRTLVISARPRKGSARIHAWARHPAFSDFNRLGDWIPRPCGFDTIERKAIIPLRPFRAAAVWRSNEFTRASSSTHAPDGPSTSSFAPVLGAAIPLRIDGGWRMESPLPSPFVSLFASRYEIVEKSFEGLSVRFLVFPRHAELADFLLDAYEPRYLKIRRALGKPAFPFVFNESPGASAAFSDMSLSSGKLDALDELIEDYDASRRDAFQIFNTQYREFLVSFLRTWARAAIPEADEPFLLRDSLVEYLYEFGFDRGSELPKEIARERVRSLQPFTPWAGAKIGRAAIRLSRFGRAGPQPPLFRRGFAHGRRQSKCAPARGYRPPARPRVSPYHSLSFGRRSIFRFFEKHFLGSRPIFRRTRRISGSGDYFPGEDSEVR